MHLIVVQQQADAPAGLVGEWATERGYELEVVRAPELVEWPAPDGAAAIVALGSDRSVHASRDPWIPRQLRYLRGAHDAGVPVLGICFGGQALSAALGGTVRAAGETELGWVDVEGEDGFGGRWFTWHEDVFTLPPGAEELARGDSGLQAFALGRSVGLQYHPEVTPAIVEDWLSNDNAAGADREGLTAETRRTEIATRARAYALLDRISERWGA